MAGDQVNSNRNEDDDDDDDTEESSGEDEHDSNAINPSSNEHGEPRRRQVFGNVWYWSQFILMRLVFYIASGWEWLTSILIGISRSSNENCHRHCRPVDLFIIISMLFVMTLIITQMPVNVDNTGTRMMEMPDDVNNTHQNLPMINEDAILNNDAPADPVADNEDLRLDIGAINDEYTVSQEAVDNQIYNSDSFISTAIQNDTNINREEIHFSPTIRPYEDHEVETEDSLVNNNSDASSLLFDMNYELNNANDPIDDSDRWSDISHITDNWSEDDDEEIISTDDGYSSENETDWLIDDENDIWLGIEHNPHLDLHDILPEDASSNQLLLTDGEQSELMSSMEPSADDRLNEVASSSQVFENNARVVDPLDEIQAPTDSNSDLDKRNEQINSNENSLHTGNQIDHTDQPITSSVVTFNDVQENAQSHASEVLQNFAPDASSGQMEQTAIDKNEDMEHSTGSMNFEPQKQLSHADDSDKERFKQNIH